MKTIEETIKDKLVNYGLWPEEAETVMKEVEQAPENESMQGRWHESPEDYPPAILSLAWLSAKDHAIEYLKINKPLHFALRVLEA